MQARTDSRSSVAFGTALAAVTAVAFALRLDGLHESLFGDELYTQRIVSQGSLSEVLDSVAGSAITPPLHYVLAWASVRLGDDETTIRLPSLLLGTGGVPLTYFLGREVAGRMAGLLAAATMALSPLAIFFSTEARTYATVLFLVPLSTLALLRAVETRRAAWWSLYAVAAALALYAHYTAVAPVAAQAAWALWHERASPRRALIAHVAIALVYLPWLPQLLGQDRSGGTAQIEAIRPLSLESVGDAAGRLMVGHQLVGLGEIPGPFFAWLFGAAVVVLAAGVALSRGNANAERSLGRVGLLVLLALSTPAAALVYSLVGNDIFTARNLLASLPALVVLLALLVVRLPAPVATPVATVMLLAFGMGAWRTLDPDRDRPPFGQAADFLDRRAHTDDPVVEVVFVAYRGLFTHHLDVHFDAPHPIDQTGLVQDGTRDPWARAMEADRFFVVGPWPAGSPPDKVAARFGDVDTHVWRGIVQIAVTEFRSALAPGRYRLLGDAEGEAHLAAPGARAVTLGSPDVSGHVDSLHLRGRLLELSGWAGVKGERAAEAVPVFVRRRFVTALRPVRRRPDVAAALGAELAHAGFSYSVRLPPSVRSAHTQDVRVFAVSGADGAELEGSSASAGSAP